jgi:hypothetical protein
VCMLIEQLDQQRKYLCQRMCVLTNTFEQYCRNIEPLLFQRANAQRPV